MMGYTYFEEGVLPEGDECNPTLAGTETSSLLNGSFPLRRTQHFNDIWHEKIISHNLRLTLVGSIAMHYVNRGVSFSDLIKDGNQGLTHALENFELEGGSRFSVYATRCIRLKIERAIMGQSGNNRASGTSKIRPLPTIADLHPDRQRISSGGAKTHLQCA